jgi:hypothetical protein
MLPSIWIMFISEVCRARMRIKAPTFTESYHKLAENSKLLQFTQPIFLITLILSQWLLPKNQIDSEDIYSLVINSLSMSLDMHELLGTCFKDNIIKDDSDCHNFGIFVTLLVLSTWSCSLVLLSVNSDAKTRNSNKKEAIEANMREVSFQENYSVSYFKWTDQEYLPLIFENFYWKYVITMSAMDGPFFLVRMVILVNYEITDARHLFFMLKNLIQIMLQLIRILGRIYFRMA